MTTLLELYQSQGEYNKLLQECSDNKFYNFKKILSMALSHTRRDDLEGNYSLKAESSENPPKAATKGLRGQQLSLSDIDPLPMVDPRATGRTGECGDQIKRQYKNYIRVKVLCNWCTPKELCQEWDRMSQGDCKWNNIQITWEDTYIDYYVIINKPQEMQIYIPEKTIIFHMEPWCYGSEQDWGVKTWGEWAEPSEKKFLQVRTHKKYHCNGFWQISYDYNTLKKLIPVKRSGNAISTICSSKYYDPGHIKRVDFIKFLESKNNPSVNVDVYGYDNKLGFKNYKGSIPVNQKEIGIEPYRYYFICENNSENNYMTEKIWEPLLCESLCFYWGCPNLDDYIDRRAYIVLNMDNFEEAYQTIQNAIENNLWEERLPIIRKERQKILDKYNFFPTLEGIIQSRKINN
jgi:hypothetical protein